MSNKEREQLYKNIEYGLKLSVERCLKEKSLKKEKVVLIHPNGKTYKILASTALRRFKSAK